MLIPSGMVVGLRIPGAAQKFADLLEEETIPLGIGDVIVFYTDGISEAMNPASDLFGEARLGQIVEDVSGRPFDRYLRDHVFDPLGMTDTTLAPAERVSESSP